MIMDVLASSLGLAISFFIGYLVGKAIMHLISK